MFALSNDIYKDLLYATLLSCGKDIDKIRSNELYTLFTHDNYVDNMQRFIELCGIDTDNKTLFTFYVHLFDILWTYNNSLHFIVKNLPCMNLNFNFFKNLEDDLCIDFKYAGDDYYITVRQYYNEHIRYVEPKDINNPYISISLYMKKDYALILESAIPIYQLYVFPITGSFKIRFLYDNSKANLLASISGSNSSTWLPFRSYSEYVQYDEVVNEISKFHYPNKDVVLSVTQYALSQMYCEKEYIDIREGKVAKYKKPEIKCFNIEPSGEINVISISKYKTIRAEKIYKGGHHASPITHRRRGYYRRSMNGDYLWDNTTNSYRKVYGGAGTHIFIKPCIVNPGKTPLKSNYYIV